MQCPQCLPRADVIAYAVMNIGVIGAGVFGLASAIELRARGHDVTVFDQGAVPYANASSTDVSKAIRRTWYAGDNEAYVELVERAAKRWREWEERFDTRFYHQVGGISILGSLERGEPMHASVEFLRAQGAEIDVLSAREARERFPQFRMADHEVCVYDRWAGYIESARAVSFMARLARDGDVALRENAPVSVIHERPSAVEVAYDDGRAVFDRVVVAAGVWVGRLLPEIDEQVKVTHQEMLFLEPAEPARFASGVMPVWGVDPDGEAWYGFPLLREGYVKVSKEPLGDPVDPDVDRRYRTVRRAGPSLSSRADSGNRPGQDRGRSLMSLCRHSRRPLHRRLGPWPHEGARCRRRERSWLQIRGLHWPRNRRCAGRQTQPSGRPLPDRQPLRVGDLSETADLARIR